jgi:hypothetical protein
MRSSHLSENSSARSYRWVWIWLVLGVLFALLLLFNSVRDYFFVARILSVQQVRHQVTERIASFDRALAENPPSDQPLVNLLATEMATASKKPIWILLRDPDGKVIGLEGTREREVFTHEQEITRFRNREPLFDVVPSSQGEAVVEVFPLYVRPRQPPSQQSSNETRHGPFVIATEVAMPLSAADRAVLWPIRRNLVVNTSAGLALLLTVALSALGFRSYVHGKRLEQQLEVARQVQANLLPKNVELSGGIQVAVEYQPADEVAGDFYDVFNTGRGPALVIGDVSGKGVPAALLMGVIHGAVRSAKWSESKAAHECETVELNRLLCERASDDRFATMFWCYCDAETGIVHYVNAGHCPPMLVGLREGKAEIKRLDAGGSVLGLLSDAGYVQGTVATQPGDLMLLYSDGLVEAANAAGEEFGESRLTSSLLESIGENPHKIRDSILAALRNFLDHRSAQDDLTCVVARFATTSEPVRSDGDFVPCERKS